MTEKEMLLKLLPLFWNNEGGLEWSFREGVTIADEDAELNAALVQYIKDNGIKTN